MTWSTYLVALLVVSSLLLRKFHNLSPDGPLMLHNTNDAINPHWSAPVQFVMANLVHIIAHAAALQDGISHLNPQPTSLLPTPCNSLLEAAMAALP